MGSVVTYNKEDQTGIITINRPEVMNSLNMAIFKSLDDILEKIKADPGIRAIIVTGAGKAFVAGADINELLGYNMQEGWIASRFQQSVFGKLEKIGRPSIAALNGYAMGGGLELALACTMRIASQGAKLGFPELGLGIIPAFGGTQRLVRTVGYSKAAELILLRTILSAEEARQIGILNFVEADAMSKAKEIAKNLAALSPVATRLELELLLESQDSGFDRGLALESSLAALAVSSKEAKELLQNFLSKGKDKK